MATKNQAQITINGDVSGLKKAIKEASSEVTALNKVFKLNKEQLKGTGDQTELLQQKVEILKEEYEKQSKIVEDSIKVYGENSTEVTKARTKQEQLKNALNEANEELAMQSSKAIALGESWTSAGNKVEKVGNTISKVGTALSVVSAGVLAGATACLSASVDFESAFAGVKKTVNGTDEELEELRQGILDMSTEMPTAATEIAAVAESAGQLGIEAENVLSFTEVMIELGETTNLSADEAATSLAKFANITKTSASDYERLGSVIVDLGNNFATTEADIVDMATNLAATGELTGLTEPQIMALATAMSSVGIEAEAGGSAMSKLLKKIQTACETGGDSLEEFASVANKSVEEFKSDFEKDAVGALTEFITGLNDTERNGKSAIVVLEDMGLTETRLSNTILSLSSASDTLTGALETAENAWDSNTALSEEYAKRTETTESQVTLLKQEVEKLAIEFGDELAPSLRDLLDDVKPLLTKIADWIKKFSELNDGTKQTTIKIGALVVAIGPFVKILGTATTGVGSLMSGIGKLTTAFGQMSAKSKTASTDISSLSSSVSNSSSKLSNLGSAIGAVTAVVGVGVAAWELYKTKLENIKKEVKESALEIYDLADSLEEASAERDSFNTSLSENLSSELVEIDMIESLKKELDTMIDSNGKVKEGYEQRAEYIANELSEAMGIEIDLATMTADKYEELSDSIDEAIQKQRAEVILETLVDSYKNAMTSIAEDTENYNNALAQQADAQAYYTEKQNEYLALLQKYEDERDTMSESQKVRLNDEIVRAKAVAEQAKENLDQADANVETTERIMNDDLDNIAEYNYNLALYQQGTAEGYEEMYARVVYSTTGMAKDSGEALAQTFSSVADQLEYYKQKAMEKGDESYEYQTELLEKTLAENAKTLVSMTSTTNELSEDVVSAWKTLANSSYDTYSEVIAGLPDETASKIQLATQIAAGDTELPQAFSLLAGKTVSSFKNVDFSQAGADAAVEIKNGAEKKSSIFSTLGSMLGGKLVASFSSSLSLSGTSTSSHADGIAYVPYNGYVARLHEGERVLSKAENAEYIRNNISNRANNNNVSVNIYAQQVSDSDLARITNYINRSWGKSS